MAISLRQIAPQLRVCLADAGRNPPFRVGESVPPPIKPYLDHLEVWPAFRQAGHSPSFHTLSAWAGPELVGNEFFLYVYNTGWRLDRVRFDRMLVDRAVGLGASMLTAPVCALNPGERGWEIDCGAAGKFSAGFVVDAGGRRAPVARLLRLKPIVLDRLVASAVFFEQPEPSAAPGADAAVIEACRDGWWYTAALPGGRRVAMLMTDTDIARQRGAADFAAWREQLALTRHVGPLVAGGRALAEPSLWPAVSRCFDGAYPPGVLAVGDAISSFDPLSSQGIVKALRSGLFGSYALADHFLRGTDTGIARYFALVKQEFAAYRATWREYYAQVRRWPEAPFWRRRNTGD
jgi:flavin-dependent dehydrogenase